MKLPLLRALTTWRAGQKLVGMDEKGLPCPARNPRSPGERGFEFPWLGATIRSAYQRPPRVSQRSRITEGHSNDSPTASLLWRRQPASRTSPFPGRGTAPSENKSTFWVIPHTHWEGAVFKTRAEYLEMGLPNILKPMKRLKQQPDYRFVLDQVAYVKPFLERYPDQERDFRRFLAEGRLQLVGGLDEFRGQHT